MVRTLKHYALYLFVDVVVKPHVRQNTALQQVPSSTPSTVNLPAASYFLRDDNLPQRQQISIVHSVSVF
jgi:hypothetical protein